MSVYSWVGGSPSGIGTTKPLRAMGTVLVLVRLHRPVLRGGRVGAGDFSPEPLTEPDLWAHIRLFKLGILKQLELFHGPHRVEVLPSKSQAYQAFSEPSVGVRLVSAEARAACPMTANSVGRFPGHPTGNAAT
jgi:hypothetical protein